MAAHEFDLIERIRARCTARDDVLLGIGDDAALVQAPAGQHLAISTDTLICGVHYPAATAPADIGWKALAVNLSDMAAMGAEPHWLSLALSLPQADAAWLDGFLDGFLQLAQHYGVQLIGGDTTRGPQSISVTVIGSVPPGQALRRDGARLGDDVWISGVVGEAAAALRQWQQQGFISSARLAERLNRPQPRLELGQALRGIAHACIDVSDGLLADLGHIARASGLGADVQVEALPLSAELAAIAESERQRLQLAGGDDYELCFCAAPECADAVQSLASRLQTPLTRIGRMVAGHGVRVLDAEGAPMDVRQHGYRHFADA